MRRDGRAELRAFLLGQANVGVGYGTDGLRHADAHRDRLLAGHARLIVALEMRIVLDVGRRRAVARAAETGEAVAQIKHEALTALLAVVDDVDAGVDLLCHDGVAALGLERGVVDRLATRALDIKVGQGGGPRQAAGMRGQNAMFAALHFRSRGSVTYRLTACNEDCAAACPCVGRCRPVPLC